MNNKSMFCISLLWAVVFCLLLSAFPTASIAKQVYKLPIKGQIDRELMLYVRRVVLEANNADAIILEVETFGGWVDAAVQIRDELLRAKPKTIAFVRRAISAGALISMAAEHIVMSPGATIGDAAPIQLDGKPAGEKVVSYFRAEMRSTAETHGRRGDIAEAMVDPNIEIEGITEKDKLLTLTTKDALKDDIQLAEAEVSTFEEVLEHYSLSDAEVILVEINWMDRLVWFLTNPFISWLLMIGGLIGLFIEFKTPGFGIGGTVGFICLGLFFWAHFIVRLAGWEELLLLLAGIVLLLIEIFVIPGFGIVGILGIIFIITSLSLALVGRFELLTIQDIKMALSKVTAALIASIIVSIVLMKLLPRTFVGKQVILQTTQEHEEGYVAQSVDRVNLVGMTGVALTPLHPSGTAVIDEKRYDVVTEGDFIDKNAKVKVIDVEGARIVVRKIDESTEA